jgi:hypothetical protein
MIPRGPIQSPIMAHSRTETIRQSESIAVQLSKKIDDRPARATSSKNPIKISQKALPTAFVSKAFQVEAGVHQ